MTVGVIDSGVHSRLLYPGKLGLTAFSSWTWNIAQDGWMARCRESDPDEIARWWLEEGRPEVCWDTCGHGTAVVRTLAEGAGNISLVAAQVLDSGGRGDEGLVLPAWDWVMEHKPAVINFSLGCHSLHPELWYRRAELCQQAGIKIFAAAGKAPGYPACLPQVVAVGDTHLKLDETLDPDWRERIKKWVQNHELPSWSGTSSSSLACATAAGEYIRSGKNPFQSEGLVDPVLDF